jgi:hypothetical protein
MEFVDYIVEKSKIEFERKASVKKSFFGFVTNYSEGEISIDKSRTGFCIKTKEIIPFNPARPYSKSGFDTWIKEGGAKNSNEKYCHKCGNTNASSMLKPICLECYRIRLFKPV